jgi:hypothetical protein
MFSRNQKEDEDLLSSCFPWRAEMIENDLVVATRWLLYPRNGMAGIVAEIDTLCRSKSAPDG